MRENQLHMLIGAPATILLAQMFDIESAEMYWRNSCLSSSYFHFQFTEIDTARFANGSNEKKNGFLNEFILYSEKNNNFFLLQLMAAY